MSMKSIHTNQAPAAIGPYSQAIEANGMVFASGQIPINPTTGEFVEGGIQEQTHQALLNARNILQAAGAGLEDVVKTTVYLSDIANFAAMNEVYAQFFSEPFPARSAVAVKDLPKGALVEIEVLAVKPSKKKLNSPGLLGKALLILFLFLTLSSSAWGQSQASLLVTMLEKFQQTEDITPDRFFQDIDTLRAEILRQDNATSKAIYQATLAHLLMLNTHRATTHSHKTESPADSIREWSYMDYISHASLLYKESLGNMELLHKANTKEWIPLVKRGKDENIYKGDMLSVVWRAMTRDLKAWMREDKGLPTADSVAAFYSRQGLREAALCTQLESVWDSKEPSPKDKLLALRQEYGDLEAGIEVYLQLASARLSDPDKQGQDRLSWIEEAKTKWPNSRWKGNLENLYREIQSPLIEIRWPRIAYPQDTIKVPIQTKNIRDIHLSVYQLPSDFNNNLKEASEKKLLKMVRKQGKRTWNTCLQLHREGSKAEVFQDTIDWISPDCGLYAIILEASTNAPLDHKPQPQMNMVRVSRLGVYHQVMHDGRIRITTVDQKTGEPLPNVNIEVFTKAAYEDKYTPISTLTTNPEGCALLNKDDQKNIYIKVSRANDNALEHQRLSYWVNTIPTKERTEHHMIISTDRSIYRPGQKIMMSAVAYSQKGWDAEVIPNKEYDIVLYDSNRKSIWSKKCKTDEMGVLADSITLPSTCLPGVYNITNQDHSNAYIRVEEYVRPTFRVELSQPETPTLNADSVNLEGKVLTYSGVPLTNVRITGSYRWTYSWWLRYLGKEMLGSTDTLWTNEEGRFMFRVPVKGNANDLKLGRMLELSVDALSPQGETQQGHIRVPLCSTPLRISGRIDKFICKEKLNPWTLDLFSRTDQSVKGSVNCKIIKDGQEKKSFVIQAGVPTLPEELKELESGWYELHATANIQGDTASWNSRFELNSLSDTILYHQENLYLKLIKNTFSEKEAGQLQIGTSLRDAWIRITSECAQSTAIDTLVHLSNTLQTWTIPYRKEYGQGIHIRAILFHKGKMEDKSSRLMLEKPSYNLLLHWDSFRDHLRLGQKEEWTLTIKHPDGKPAQANLTACLYDASLDEISKHHFWMNINRPYRITSGLIWHDIPGYDTKKQISIGFTPRYVKEYNRTFSSLDIDHIFHNNDTHLEVVPMLASGVRLRGTSGRKTLKASAKSADISTYDTVEEAFTGQIAGLDMNARNTSTNTRMEEAGEAEDDAEEMDMNSLLRTNLQETAFYMPRLRTDEQGQLKICFTLPESMTSWHLLGMAHTAKMLTGMLDTTIVAEKEIMAELHLPRFLRNGDQGMLTASIRNRSHTCQQGKATLAVYDTETEKVLMQKTVRFHLNAESDTTFLFPYSGNMEHPALTIKWVAQEDDFGDGEQRYLPVLSDMQNVTETKAFTLSNPGTHIIDLSKLFAHNSKNAVNRSLTIEYTRDPKWLAIQTLPSMASPRWKDALSLTSAYYAGATAYSIGQKFPEVRETIREWDQKDTAMLESPLARNQELTNIILQETPWALEANNERDHRHRLATLFHDVSQDHYRMTMLNALKNLQYPDGSFAWYPGMKGSIFITQNVACQLARLYAQTTDELPIQREMRQQAFKFLLQEMAKDIKATNKSHEQGLLNRHLNTLYTIGLTDYRQMLSPKEQADIKSMLDLLRKYAGKMDREERALAAIILHQYGDQKLAESLMNRLYALLQQPDGKHLAYQSNSHKSMNSKTSEHVLMMEAIRMIEPHDTATLNALQEWLVGMKHTQEWDNAAQTADAVYALLSTNAQFLQGTDKITLRAGQKSTTISTPDTRLGYVRQRVETKATPQKLIVEKKNQNLSYGAVYAQYQIPTQETEAQQEGLNIRRDIINMEHLQVGDRVHVRYTITADRDYEYVRLMAPRPASAEPDTQRSGYRFFGQLGTYQAIHDASTEYFIDRMPRGTHVIEEDWLITSNGSFVLPSALLQCLYAPDYQAHTAGSVVKASLGK